MDDGEFLRLFHNGNLSGEEFRHRGHLRLAWLVLSKHSMIEAESMVAREIRRFAVPNGASNRDDDTLTRFWVRVMGHATENAQAALRIETLTAHIPHQL